MLVTGTLCHYERLGVPSTASSDHLRRAFRQRSKDLHPDTTSLPAEYAAREFRLLCESYALLSDPERRRIYDISRHQPCPAPAEIVMANLLEYSPHAVPRAVEQRRPLSSGELFSLLLLSVTLLLCILFCLGVAWWRDRQVEQLPTWLIVKQTASDPALSVELHDVASTGQDPVESPLTVSSRSLAAVPGS